MQIGDKVKWHEKWKEITDNHTYIVKQVFHDIGKVRIERSDLTQLTLFAEQDNSFFTDIDALEKIQEV